MQNQNKDETRYLAKLLAVIPVLIGVRQLIAVNQELSTFTISLPTIEVIALIFSTFTGMLISFFMFYIAWRLFKCSSLWNVPSWMSKATPSIHLFQCHYLSINQHKRAGLIAGIITLITLYFLPAIISLSTGLTAARTITRITFKISFYPLKCILNTLDITPPESFLPALLIITITTTFTAGFIAGLTASKLKQKMGNKSKNITSYSSQPTPSDRLDMTNKNKQNNIKIFLVASMLL